MKIERVAGTTVGNVPKGSVIETIAVKHIIVATGARPRRFDSMPLDHKRILDSSSAMILTDRPGSVVIIGAGAIGVEFGYYFASFGAEVTILEMMDRIVPVEDKDSSRELAKAFKKQGIKVLPSTKVTLGQARPTAARAPELA